MAKEVKQAEEKAEKGQTFNCGICNVEWSSKVKRAGVRLCAECVEIRRALNGFVRRGLEVKDVKIRAQKALEMLEA